MDNAARDIAHTPVLLDETLSFLAVRPGGLYIDATVGSGGHAAAVLKESAPDGRLLGIDADPDALSVARAKLAAFGDRAILVQRNYADLATVAHEFGFHQVNGILFDLGLSSRQLGPQGRGFSFQEDAPLDMRLDPQRGETAADLVNRLSEQELADLIFSLGDERAARRIARAIVAARPLRTSGQLAVVIERAIGRRGKTHPATQTFLALRRAVNEDVQSLEAALPQAVELLAAGGRLVVIAFHSGEDRIVKDFMRRESRDCICPPKQPVCTCGHKASLRLLMRHVVVPTDEERRENPRSRSARLRVAEKLPS